MALGAVGGVAVERREFISGQDEILIAKATGFAGSLHNAW
jgi:hypothetical protein